MPGGIVDADAGLYVVAEHVDADGPAVITCRPALDLHTPGYKFRSLVNRRDCCLDDRCLAVRSGYRCIGFFGTDGHGSSRSKHRSSSDGGGDFQVCVFAQDICLWHRRVLVKHA